MRENTHCPQCDRPFAKERHRTDFSPNSKMCFTKCQPYMVDVNGVKWFQTSVVVNDCYLNRVDWRTRALTVERLLGTIRQKAKMKRTPC